MPDDTPTLPIKKVGIIGAGTMGGGIAMNFANAGIPVIILEMKQEALDHGLGVVKKNYDSSAAKGRFTAEDVQKRFSLLTGTLKMEDLSGLRPDHRSRVRAHGHQEGCFRQAGQDS